LSLGARLSAGIYRYQWGDSKNSRLRFGGEAQAFFHLAPWVSLFASGGYTRYEFSSSRPIGTLVAGAGISLNLSEIFGSRARVRAEKTAQEKVFPVSYAWYEKNPFATVQITNEEPNAITQVRLSFFLERYMNQATSFALLPALGPGEQAEIPVTALFNESMLDLTENAGTNAVLRVEYQSLGADKQSSFPFQMPVYHRNAMSWDDDRRAASFVSARDPAAVYFARYVESALRSRLREDRGMPRAVVTALALFEALRAYGINYVIDPSSSYVEMSENSSSLDSLNYPYQTLLYRGGDCDDLSILFCSLLEVLGVRTAFITIPGHIYMAFELDAEDSGFFNPDVLIEHEGGLWMPVEITLTTDGFFQAWRTGLREWKAAGEEGRLYPMRENWRVYPPVSVPGAGDRLPAMPDDAQLTKAFEAEIRAIRK
jgi:hypothetical protein